jgi:hypothetical protein
MDISMCGKWVVDRKWKPFCHRRPDVHWVNVAKRIKSLELYTIKAELHKEMNVFLSRNAE